jgi:hypothetical protein
MNRYITSASASAATSIVPFGRARVTSMRSRRASFCQARAMVCAQSSWRTGSNAA